MSPKFFTQAELARRWRMSGRTLERWRSLGKGPRFCKLGSRCVYPEPEVLAYESENLRQSASEPRQR
jgi:hypothetical protein